MHFIAHIPRPDASLAPSALDFASLNRLQHGVVAGADHPAAQQKAVARQFEALFIQQLLKQARQTASSFGPGLFDSSAMRMAQSLGDEQLALNMADPGLGLAQALLAQIRVGAATQAGLQDPVADPEALGGRVQPAGAALAGSGLVDSVSALIDRLAHNPVVERVTGAIRGAPQHIRDFVERFAPAADRAAAQSGVPAKLILSQAALESGWGQREIMRPDGRSSHNLFGIKATGGWTGDVVHVVTTEYADGVPYKVSQPFRSYASYADSLADHARLISHSARYRAVLAAPTAEAAAVRVQQAGYATDPSYADKLIAIMGYFNAL